MHLPEDRLRLTLQHILEVVWHTSCQSFRLLGEGEYGWCYGITFGCAPHRAVVKWHKYPGMAAREHQQLIVLRSHAPVPVPRVYAHLPETEPGEALVMEWLPGISCPRPEALPQPLRQSLQRQAVDLLQRLHTIEHPAGYGSFDGPLYQRWWDYFGQRVRTTHQAISGDKEARSYFGPQVLALMDRTLEYGERILDTAPGRPVLLHGDFCFSNLLFDAETWRIVGLLDPLDAEWGERELDLVNLINGHTLHFSLLNRYREATELGPAFPARYWFYQVWKWLFYFTRVQVACRAWVVRCGRELEKAIDTYL